MRRQSRSRAVSGTDAFQPATFLICKPATLEESGLQTNYCNVQISVGKMKLTSAISTKIWHVVITMTDFQSFTWRMYSIHDDPIIIKLRTTFSLPTSARTDSSSSKHTHIESRNRQAAYGTHLRLEVKLGKGRLRACTDSESCRKRLHPCCVHHDQPRTVDSYFARRDFQKERKVCENTKATREYREVLRLATQSHRQHRHRGSEDRLS